MPDACVDCRTTRFASGFTETIEARDAGGTRLIPTLRLHQGGGAPAGAAVRR